MSLILLGASFVHFLIGALLFLVSTFLILLILVQRGRGGGLTGALGGMGGQSAFGTKAGDVFTKITVGTAVVWILLCITAISVFSPPKRDTGSGPATFTNPDATNGDSATDNGTENPTSGTSQTDNSSSTQGTPDGTPSNVPVEASDDSATDLNPPSTGTPSTGTPSTGTPSTSDPSPAPSPAPSTSGSQTDADSDK